MLKQLGVIDPEVPQGEAVSKRLPFTTMLLVDDSKCVQMQTTYPVTTGRNFYEAVRALDGLRLAGTYQVLGPPTTSNPLHGLIAVSCTF